MSTHLPPTRYSIVPADPFQHLFEVTCTVDEPDPRGQAFELPAWVPGSYLIREFARHFVKVDAQCNGQQVTLRKEAKATWRAAPCSGPLTVTALVYAFDLSVRTAYLDASRGYFNGASVFLRPEGRAGARCLLDIHAAPGIRGWRVATTLTRAGASPWGFGRYEAADYDELIDHPVELSDFAHRAFEAGGAVHDIVLSGRHDADMERIATDLARVCQWQIDLFGGASNSRAPFPRYLFQVTVVGDGYGGLEHRSSTSLVCSRSDLPRRGEAKISDGYRSFLGLASHEYFHAWNIKRIRPLAFSPYDLTRENYTSQLWAFEGFTSYYDDLALVRSGVIDIASYLELAGRMITSVLRTPGRHVQSVAESSFDAWIKFYRQDEDTPNAVVSYYAKGAIVAMALDLVLRERGSSLDALLRVLWERHGATGIGVPEDGIARLACEITGEDVTAFFDRYVDGTDDPPLDELLAGVGVQLKLREAEGRGDRGGKPAQRSRDQAARSTTLGLKLASGQDARIATVFRDGPAARAGLAGGDVIVAVDGLKASPDGLDALQAHRKPGDRVVLHAFRRDELMTFDVLLDAAPRDTCYLVLDEAASKATLARRLQWLGG